MTDQPPAADAPKREVLTIYVAEDEDGIRLDRWFRRRWPHLSNIQVQKMARSGQIRVDGARIKPEGRLTAGAAVRVPPLPEPGERPDADKQGLSDRDIAEHGLHGGEVGIGHRLHVVTGDCQHWRRWELQ